jgi:hypothetical protein
VITRWVATVEHTEFSGCTSQSSAKHAGSLSLGQRAPIDEFGPGAMQIRYLSLLQASLRHLQGSGGPEHEMQGSAAVGYASYSIPFFLISFVRTSKLVEGLSPTVEDSRRSCRNTFALRTASSYFGRSCLTSTCLLYFGI